MRRVKPLPPRPDVFPRPAPVRGGRDPVLVAVIGIGLVALVTAVALVIAPPDAPVTVAAPSAATASPTPTHAQSHADVPTGPGGEYSFLDVTYADGARVPVRWNPCQPIEYQLEFQMRPPGARAAVNAAIDQTSIATGIPFQYDGRTGVHPQHLFDTSFFASAIDSTYRPVLITIVSHATFKALGATKRAIAFTHPEEGNSDLNHQYVAGIIVADGSIHYAHEGRWSLALVLQHELGHLMGLGHVRAADELMFSFEVAPHTIPDPITDWGPGDLRGLQQLGADQGCLQTVHVRG